MELTQYDIVLVNLDPTAGSEIKKTRPCVIISPDEMNRYLRTTVVAPMTSRSKKYPTRINIVHEGQSGWVAIDQIRTIDKMRIIKTLGRLSTSDIKTIKSILKETYID
ncbi:MAG: type II toxin-antitoxin system PemK/MazF family toxin [Bacteroidota bacterium]